MPVLELTCREGALSSKARAELISMLGELLQIGNDQPKTNSFRFAPSLQIIELPASAMHDGAHPDTGATYLLSVATPAGSLGIQRKADFIADAIKAILTADGGAPEDNRVRIHIHEIPLGNWDAWQRADHVRRAAQPGTIHSIR
jgi:phenylpyruvate tautomerase PptA (4-oxalocrotonate tautomerase family)